MKTGWRIILIALLQTLALAGMVGAKQWTLSTGRPVVLDLRPVDPRSLFSGDFVILNYDINRLAINSIQVDKEEIFRRQPIYVRLIEKEDRWQAVSAHPDLPLAGDDEVVLRGQVEWINSAEIRVKYGIEAFYVPEGKGRDIEQAIRRTKVKAEIAVGDSGRAVLRALIIDGEYRYNDPLF